MKAKRFIDGKRCSVMLWFAESARLESLIREKLKEVGYGC